MFRLFKFLIRLILLFILIGVITYGYARYIEPYMVKTKEVKIESLYTVNNEKGLKVAVFADTHFSDYYTPKNFTKVINALEESKPDIVIFAGDLIDYYSEYTGDTTQISAALASIEAPHGKFAVFGNHDYGGGAEREYEEIMNAGGFKVLKNEYYPMDDLGISLIGIDDVLIGHGDPTIASYARPDYFNIVICHEPDLIDEVLEYNVDLMLSGHTHGRQINIPFFDDDILPPYGRKYVKGLYQFENHRKTQLYVTSGIGMTKKPYRFMSPPEVSMINILEKK